MSYSRIILSETLPLETPLSLHIFPSYYCNFKCAYCLHSLSSTALLERGFKIKRMNIDTYMNAIDGASQFPSKLKAIIFAGHGEPTTHKLLPTMISYANMADIAERIEIVTNAALLTPDMCDALAVAGLNNIRVSLQGVTDKMYSTMSGTSCKVSRILKNLTYLHEYHPKVQINAKIVNAAIKDEAEEKLLYSMFGPVCDTLDIEYLIPFIKEIDHTKLVGKMDKCKHGNPKSSSDVCSMPFYMLVVDPDGNVLPCCSSEIPFVYGNVNDKALSDIWTSARVNGFLLHQLIDMRKSPVCNRCSVPAYGLQEGDYLDNAREELLDIYLSRSPICQK